MRIAIFCGLGPPLGAVCILMLGLSHILAGEAIVFSAIMLVYLPLSYLPGFAPAILTCQADDYLSDKLSRWPRMAVTGGIGAIVVAAWLTLVSAGGGFDLGVAQFVLVGALPIGGIPAAVCSVLADRWDQCGRPRAGTNAGADAHGAGV